MKMITWVNHCLNSFNRFFAISTLSLTLGVAYAKVDTGHLFVHLSDAMEVVPYLLGSAAPLS
ncbi:hypothetical protein Q7378_07685 [Glaesserella parasuis]|uniref:hypothetical protein n=1 Tax=Glaesserella parasuis TaxID=738 RepID=UPI000DD42753|nr:hypothetical protein [Glaesserella parasuis]MDG6281670.1 hypothetical protein [Glaesserella parasuis]MDG6325220.1 hypothetical protein [Glaesserella parasuis]MDG6455104.1 hypothetical protein [Glaesserella parasuis]MDO9924471.1 hypothetical protein [Glaesserella parasuis]MDO9939281.1 hypothetical protein [Glaesserella parasuis]